MKSLGLTRHALPIAAAELLAGCGGGSPSSAPAGLRSGVGYGGTAAHVGPKASRKGLVYVATLFGALEVYTWPELAPAGTISGLDVPFNLCVDARANVWVPDFGSHIIYEYAHGGSAPIRTLTDDYGAPESCSSDPTTGNLAIGDNRSGSGPGDVLVYKKGRGRAADYAMPNLASCFSVAYDDEGNLFANGTDANLDSVLAELPKGGSSFERVTVKPSVSSPGSLQWDGKYLAERDAFNNVIYQFQVSGATLILKGATKLRESGILSQVWITGGTKRHPQGTAVVGADYIAYALLVWNYPAGGAPTNIVQGLNSSPEGLTVSPDSP